jgi:type IV conjugative transfer system protein TraL
MADMTRHVILNTVDTPLKYLIWTKGELGLFILPIAGGLFCGQFVAGLVLSFIHYRLFKIYRERFGRDQLQAVCYWFLPPTPSKYPAIPVSWIREYTS